MITYKDIKIAINQKLQSLDIEINSKDVTEGFIRPSFFVEFLNPTRSGSENQIHKSLSVQIYYFPTDRHEYSLEVMDVQEQLENLFDLKLKVQDRYFNVDETSSLVTDGVLNFSFPLEFYDGRDFEYNTSGIEQHTEKMEELDFDKEEE